MTLFAKCQNINGGEIPLPPYGVCDLGNINLTKFVKEPFTSYLDWNNNFDWTGYEETIRLAVRFLDNVLDVSDYPYQEVTDRARGDRRIGLCGVAGLGSFLAMMMVPYDSKDALVIAETLQEFCTKTSYKESIELAKEKGAFPNYNAIEYIQASFVKKIDLDLDYHEELNATGIRNLACMTIPPVGTGSLIAGNISNGLEPIFSLEYNRNVRQVDGSNKVEAVEDYAWGLWKEMQDDFRFIETPNYFKTAKQIDPKSHVDMQAVLQKWIDGSISKTANIPADFTIKEYEDLLWYSLESGVKGFTSFREGTRAGVLEEKTVAKKEEIKSNEPKAQPIARPRTLDGKTYKIKDPTGNIYVTLNYLEENGKKTPWEIFMFSSNENQEMYAALGKTLSAVMRRTDDIDFLIEDLKSIRSSTEAGGYFTPEYGFIKSRPQHISFILEEFVKFTKGSANNKEVQYEICPECKENSLVREGGCSKCISCLFSKCG